MSPSKSPTEIDPPVTLTVVSQNDAETCVAASGRITRESLSDPDPLEAVIGPDAFAKPILLSLAKSDYMDSSGVGWILKCHKRAAEAGGKLILHSAPPMIGNLMRMLKLERVLAIAANGAEAEAIAKSSQA